MALLLEIYTFSQILPHHNVCIVLQSHPHPCFPLLRKDGVLAKTQLRRGQAPACFLHPVSTDCSVLGLLGSREAVQGRFSTHLGGREWGQGKRERGWGYGVMFLAPVSCPAGSRSVPSIRSRWGTPPPLCPHHPRKAPWHVFQIKGNSI